MTDRDGRDRRSDGFTLLELIAVLGIVGMLLLIAIASYVPAARRAERVACEHDVTVLNRAVSTFQATSPGVVPSLGDLQPFVQNWDSTVRCPSDEATYTVDPATGFVSCVNHP